LVLILKGIIGTLKNCCIISKACIATDRDCKSALFNYYF